MENHLGVSGNDLYPQLLPFDVGKMMKKIIGFRGFPIGAKPISPRESGPLQEALDPSFRPHLKPPETIVFCSGSK